MPNLEWLNTCSSVVRAEISLSLTEKADSNSLRKVPKTSATVMNFLLLRRPDFYPNATGKSRDQAKQIRPEGKWANAYQKKGSTL